MFFSVDLTSTLDIAFAFFNALWAAYAFPLAITLALSLLGIVWVLFRRVAAYVGQAKDDVDFGESSNDDGPMI